MSDYCPGCQGMAGLLKCECGEELEPRHFNRMDVAELFERTHSARGDERVRLMVHLELRPIADVWRAARAGYVKHGNQDRLTLAREIAAITSTP